MTVDIAAIKAKLLENANKKNRDNNNQSGGDNASYAFWNIPFDTSALVRFYPDGNPDNVFFWEKREIIRLPFQGIVGGDYPTDKPVTVQVPCADMFGLTCPITAEIRPWWNDPAKKDLARVYYKKRSYLFQGDVVTSPMQEENLPENPIRRFVINPSLYEIIEKSLMNPEMEDSPTDYVSGRDFKITKTRKGEYANYSTSNWSFKTRSLSDSENQAIEQYGLFNLKDFLGRVPDKDELEAIKELFHDSLDGKPFDATSYGKYYRAFGGGRFNDSNNDLATSEVTVAETVMREVPVKESVKESVTEPVAPTADAKPSAQDILERIRTRTAASANR